MQIRFLAYISPVKNHRNSNIYDSQPEVSMGIQI